MKEPQYQEEVRVKVLEGGHLNAKVVCIKNDPAKTGRPAWQTDWDWRIIVLRFHDPAYNDVKFGTRQLYMHAFEKCRVAV